DQRRCAFFVLLEIGARSQQHELITPMPHQQFIRSGIGLKAPGKFNKDAIANAVAKTVVDTLETIQVNKQEREFRLFMKPTFKGGYQVIAVWQLSQGVMVGLKYKLAS